MPRYAAFLRGVMPGKPSMAQLKAAFESAGFTNVKTVLSSGNVVFDARAASDETLARKADAAMENEIGRVFPAIVRPIEAIRELLEADPFARFALPPDAKRVVTFFREPPRTKLPKLPIWYEKARILAIEDRHAFVAYEPTPGNPAFMTLIEKTFGKGVTTRTWETLQKVAK
ncbi:MAG TPA: DUF1697 domain-containing protein [Candidatus Elarobacter sp.]|jgi:uncharacterized protein (DUF1697 family)|nr:DUF1697 domain-containing protein [Candidatus Elarobacter sp.]